MRVTFDKLQVGDKFFFHGGNYTYTKIRQFVVMMREYKPYEVTAMMEDSNNLFFYGIRDADMVTVDDIEVWTDG